MEQVFEAACHAGSGGMNTPGSGKAGSERRLRVCEKQKGQCGWNSEGENGRKWGQRERVGKLREDFVILCEMKSRRRALRKEIT